MFLTISVRGNVKWWLIENITKFVFLILYYVYIIHTQKKTYTAMTVMCSSCAKFKVGSRTLQVTLYQNLKHIY